MVRSHNAQNKYCALCEPQAGKRCYFHGREMNDRIVLRSHNAILTFPPLSARIRENSQTGKGGLSMAAPTSSRDNQESVSTVLEYLIRRSGEKISDLAPKIGVSPNTLYSLSRRCSTKADLRTLKLIADYFGEDLSIFCGLKTYTPPVKMRPEEEALLETFRALSGQQQRMMAEVLSDMAAVDDFTGVVFLGKFSSLSDKARTRIMEMVEDMLELPKNRRNPR